MSSIERAHAQLDHIMSLVDAKDADQKAFTDSDGLISFVNLSSSFVTDNPEFAVGRSVCDKISNFYATLRVRIFGAMKNGTITPLAGDKAPQTKWDPAVTHYIQYLLAMAGGLTNYKVINETYSETQVITEFNTAFLKLLFDAAVVPEAIITDVGNFVQSVGKTLRASWDDKKRAYSTALLGQCHEAVQVATGSNTTVYFPKVKYYRIAIESHQQEFTSPCSDVKKITFNFKYTYYVTGLKASILDATTSDHQKFVEFLNKQQEISYKEADNKLDQILEGTTSEAPSGQKLKGGVLEEMNAFGVDLTSYPVTLEQRHPMIEDVLNKAVSEAA
ncbi:MAG: hypothetical protein ROO70_06610 [Labrenzia sp.]